MKFPSAEHHMPPFRIEPGDIYSACMSMKRKLTRTPEGIPIYFLANTISSLLYPLTILFNLSLSSNCIPSQWKEAFIVPVFKKGNRQNPDNYRPISLTSAICRLFETVIINKLLPFILERNLLSRYQFGFLPNRSSCSNILSSLHEWLASYSSSICTNVLYTDIKKAFDSVNHRLLVQALRTYGLNNDVVNWFQNFLSKRQQKVCINNSISSSLEVYSGVPQGSVSGPLLFLLMFNFISEPAINSQSTSIRLFADDAKVFGTDPQELQRVIDQMSTLLSTLQLFPAPKKCAILKIGKQSVINDTSFSIDNHPVQELPTFRDLGVIIANDLKWSNHISCITHKASVTSYQLRKSIKSKNIWTWIKVYKTYIRPKLEFNTPIWSPPHNKGNQDSILLESIQRKFLKFAFRKCSVPFSDYSDRLYKINLLSLLNRRIYFDLVLIFKIINNISDLLFDDYFISSNTPYLLRRHNLQIKSKLNIKTSQWANSFFGRVPPLWNNLPTNLVEIKTLEVFKSNIKTHLLNLQLKSP